MFFKPTYLLMAVPSGSRRQSEILLFFQKPNLCLESSISQIFFSRINFSFSGKLFKININKSNNVSRLLSLSHIVF